MYGYSDAPDTTLEKNYSCTLTINQDATNPATTDTDVAYNCSCVSAPI